MGKLQRGSLESGHWWKELEKIKRPRQLRSEKSKDTGEHSPRVLGNNIQQVVIEAHPHCGRESDRRRSSEGGREKVT